MRILALILLGGSLLWFLLHDSSLMHAAGTSGDAQAGYMLPPEEAPATEAQRPVAEEPPAKPPSQEPVAQPSSTTTRVVAPPAAPAQAATPEPAAVVPSAPAVPVVPAPRAEKPGLEANLAGRLLHAPAGVDEFLRAEGSAVPESRKHLARVLAALLSGDETRAAQLAQGLDTEGAITSSELEFVRRSLDHGQTKAVAASSSDSVLLRAASLGLGLRDVEAFARQPERAKQACEILSEALQAELRGDWPMDAAAMRRWSALLNTSQARHRWSKTGDWPSTRMEVEKGDSLISVRKRALERAPELVLCTGMIARANQLASDTIQPGQVLRIPTQRARMLVDLDAHWALLLFGDEVGAAWEIAVGSPGSETRPGTYYVGEKRSEPMWFPAGESPVPYGDPRNPLGTRWIELRLPDGQPSHLGFHGTNEPETIGKDTSLGCIRMRNAEVEELYEILPRGTEVRIQP